MALVTSLAYRCAAGVLCSCRRCVLKHSHFCTPAPKSLRRSVRRCTHGAAMHLGFVIGLPPHCQPSQPWWPAVTFRAQIGRAIHVYGAGVPNLNGQEQFLVAASVLSCGSFHHWRNRVMASRLVAQTVNSQGIRSNYSSQRTPVHRLRFLQRLRRRRR